MLESSFYMATLTSMGINLIYTLLALLVGLVAFRLFDKKLFPTIDFIEEIKKGNIAAGIFASTILFFIALVIASAMRG